MQFIQSYGSGEETVEIDHRTYPAPVLLEGEDGQRVLVVRDSERLLGSTWHEAHAAGATALLFTPRLADGTTGEHWFWMLAETFLNERTEHHASASYVIPAAWSGPEDRPLTYSEMVAAVQAANQEEAARPGGFVHLHAHSEFSPLDGMSTLGEMVREAKADGQKALALTDHSGCAGHPNLQFACDAEGLKPIFGIEANFTNDRFRRGVESEVDGKKVSDAKQVLGDYTHLVMWAMDDDGLRNLWGMSTEANRTGFYGRPRMDWEVLERFNTGVMASTACLRGPLAKPLLEGREEDARAILARLMGIFGDRLYVEIHTNTLPEQIRLNHMLVALACEYGLPLIVAVDAHYPCKGDRDTHQAWIAAQTNKDIQDDADLFAGGQDYHMATEAEVRAALAYLGPQVVDEAVSNTVLVAERCNARIQGTQAAPIYSKVGGAQRDVERLVEMCLARWPKKVVGKRIDQAVYEERFEREMRLLIDKGFCGYFLMVADYCRAARAAGILVGPGRGSGGGSLVAYLADIVEIDPVDADLLFERFMTEGRTELPDFDVDFPASKRPWITNYIIDKYGEDYVVRVGTHIRLKNKGVIRDLARVLKTSIEIDYKHVEEVAAIIDEAEADKAGLGMAWEDLWAQHGDRLAFYRDRYPLMFDLADKMVGRLKSYGKHAAGLVITTGGVPLTGRLPMRLAGDDLVAEFDMKALEKIGLVKFDILTLRNLDTIQMAVDLVREQRGVEVNVYDWTVEYEDPQVWEEIGEGHTMGIFQIETRSGQKMTRVFKPTSLHELADVITLVRPGPKNSGLTDTYLRRRAGGEAVTFPDPRLEQVLAKTFGCILYQEDLMATTMVLAGYDGVEADEVRSILGKKKVEKIPAAGRKFVSQAIERGMAEDDALRLWEQMAEFAKYSFNRAHAFGYGVLGYWTAWLKFHYPVQFLASVLSTVDKNRIPEFITEARRMGYKVLPPDINESGRGFAATPLAVRYGLDSVKGLGEATLAGVLPHQPFTSFEDFIERKGSGCNSGDVKRLAAVGAFDSLFPNRRALERRLEFETNGESTRCVFRDDARVPLPCGFDWSTEPNPPMIKQKGVMVPKPPPKRCTRACRNFTAPTLDLTLEQPYTDEEIRAKEKELLGIHLSGSPFDHVPEVVLDECRTAEEVEAGPEGPYQVIGVITKARKHITKTGKEMGFMGLETPVGDLDVTVFSDEWARYRHDFKTGAMAFAVVKKNDKGLTLSAFHPCP